MKKVLALALAVVMVCTMAFAVKIYDNGDAAYSGTTTEPMTNVKPGAILYFEVDELAGNTTDVYMKQVAGANTPTDPTDDKFEFVPANNKVSVTYGVGANLVKSQGWVLVGTDGDKGNLNNWQYQIALVENDGAALDKKVDFSITKVVFKATGEKANEYVFDGDLTKDNHFAKALYDYGYTTGKVTIDAANMTGKTGLNQIFTAEDTLYTVLAGTDVYGDAVNAFDVKLAVGNDDITYKLAAGQKVLRKNIALPNATVLAKKYSNWGTLSNVFGTLAIVNDTNLVGTATVTNWSNKYNAYALSADGKTISKVAVVVDDGVATIKVPAYSTGYIFEGTLQGVTDVIGAPAEVTNPGTGANDVVGVAAALAVVALVSGAAISLKK